MKKQFIIIIKILTFLSILTSCAQNIDEDNFPSTPKSKYTVMIYGAGGGDLDEFFLMSLEQTETYFPIYGIDQNQIHVTAEFNLSSPYKRPGDSYEFDFQGEGSEYKGTMRWYLSENGWVKTDNISEVQVLHNPATLTDFINYSKAKFPAEKYILILKDHGYCFDIREQPIDSEDFSENVRGVIYDNNGDNDHKPLSIFGIDEAINNSKTKLELLYFDCCLMGQIEMLYQIRNRTNYVLSSSNPGWSATNYGLFFNSLITKKTVPLAMTEYLTKMINEVWGVQIGSQGTNSLFGMDMTLTDMSKIEIFADEFEEISKSAYDVLNTYDDELKKTFFQMFNPSIQQIELAKNQKMYEYYDTPERFKYGRLFYYDLIINSDKNNDSKFEIQPYSDVHIKTLFAILSNDGTLQNHINKANEYLNDMIIATSYSGFPKYVMDCGPSLGLMFMNKLAYETNWYEKTNKKMGSEKYPTVKSCYEKLDWNQKTHWSNIFDLYVTE